MTDRDGNGRPAGTISPAATGVADADGHQPWCVLVRDNQAWGSMGSEEIRRVANARDPGASRRTRPLLREVATGWTSARKPWWRGRVYTCSQINSAEHERAFRARMYRVGAGIGTGEESVT